jgi:hypothetical protein
MNRNSDGSFLHLNTSLSNSKCALQENDRENKKVNDYQLYGDIFDQIKHDDEMLKQTGVNDSNQIAVGKHMIDDDSAVRFNNVQQANPVHKADKLLQHRSIVTTPYVGHGSARNPTKNYLTDFWINSRKSKECKKVKSTSKCKDPRCLLQENMCTCTQRGREIDRFEPLLPEVKNNVQNVKHIIPIWQRGGLNTTQVAKLQCRS